MLSSTPVAILLQLCISVGLDVDAMLTPEILTDHTWGLIEEWKAGLDAAPISLSEGLFKDDCRLLTALVNALYKYLEFESKQQPWIGGETTGAGGARGAIIVATGNRRLLDPNRSPNVPARLTPMSRRCRFTRTKGSGGFSRSPRWGTWWRCLGGHVMAHTRIPTVYLTVPRMMPLILVWIPSAEPPMLWKCLGAFHGYQRWQRVDQGHELVLLQTPGGHQALQQWEAANKKRKEMFVERWGEEMFKG